MGIVRAVGTVVGCAAAGGAGPLFVPRVAVVSMVPEELATLALRFLL